MKPLLYSQIMGICYIVLGLSIIVLIGMCSSQKRDDTDCNPDTIYVISREEIDNFLASKDSVILKNSPVKEGKTYIYSDKNINALIKHGAKAEKSRPKSFITNPFEFNPNTISKDSLILLGFTPKDANTIVNYRNARKGFKKSADFAKSYPVTDSIFTVLEPYINFEL